jgi:hypothetical protein
MLISWTHNIHPFLVIAVNKLADGTCVATIMVTPEKTMVVLMGKSSNQTGAMIMIFFKQCLQIFL